MPADTTTGPHVLTFNLEDYFQVGAFNRYVQQGNWDRFESRLEHHTRRTLDLLDRHNTKATFFVLGWVAEHYPQLVREVSDRGHEIASRGYWHQKISDMSPTEFRADLAKAKAVLENVSGRRVVGYRTADGWFGPKDLWALDILSDEGYLYDSSLAPVGRRFAKGAVPPLRPHAHHAARRYLGTADHLCENPGDVAADRRRELGAATAGELHAPVPPIAASTAAPGRW